MIGVRPIISRLVTPLLVLAMVVGGLGMGTMGHGSAQADGAQAHHQMNDMSGMAHDATDGTGDMQTADADCAMAVCCFADVEEPCADHSAVAMTARFAAVAANPALQPAPDRADKPPKRT